MEDYNGSRLLLVDWFGSYVSTTSGQRTPEKFWIIEVFDSFLWVVRLV